MKNYVTFKFSWMLKREIFRYVGLGRNIIRICQASTSAKVLPGVVPNAKEEDIWRNFLLDRLQGELKLDRKRISIEQSMKTSQAQLIRYAVSDNIGSIIAYAHNYVRGIGTQGYMTKDADQFLAVSILAIQRKLRELVGKNEAAETSAIFFSYVQLFDRTRFLGTDTRCVAILMYDTLLRWSESRPVDSNSDEIRSTLETMEEKLQRACATLNVADSSLYLSGADREAISRRWESIVSRADYPKKPRTYPKAEAVGDGYSLDLRLVDSFREPVTEDQYHGNQYRISENDKDTYVNLFQKHIASERTSWLSVDNVCKDRKPTVTMSAEQLIASWGWKERLRKSFVDLQKSRFQYPLKGYLDAISAEQGGIEEISTALLESVTAICSQGQNLVPESIFQFMLCSPIIKRVHSTFIDKLGVNECSLWSGVYDDYVAYFVDDNIARTHTHREWWNKCTSRHNIRPDYQAPMVEFSSEARMQLSKFLSDVVTEACLFPGKGIRGKPCLVPAFRKKNVSIDEESRVSEEGKLTLAPMVRLDPAMMAQFEDHQFDYILFPTSELPMTIPPRPWIDGGHGGPEYTRSKEILRSLSEFKRVDVNYEMQKRLASPEQARPVFDALNQLGSTPWKINEPMLNVLSEVFNMTADPTKADFLNKLSISSKSSTVVVPSVEDTLGANANKETVRKELWREYYKGKQAAEKKRNELNSLWCWLMYRVTLAQHFRGQVLFFPHNMDFRGRVYPISPYLSHMGDDLNRCILKFAKGKPLGPTGLSWLKLHCINLTGKLKRQSVEERLIEAEERTADMVDSADNPLNGRGWWMESEEPWQTLAACMELRDALNHPGNVADFVSHLAVHQDGSCNGLQHYAALGRDRQGGGEVNLLPSEKPADVYSSVATRVEQKRLEDEQGGEWCEVAKALRVALPQAVPRKVIKQTVMTTVYGVTMYGAVLQIKRQLKALGIDNDDTPKLASYLAEKTFHSLNDAFTSSMQLKDWFRACAKGACELMRTVEWVTPLGLPVVQPYIEAKDIRGKLVLKPKASKQIDAFPPNFVHSLDSTHMMLTSLECSRRGITFAAVHDCFWTHASTVDEMNNICRRQFVQLHNQPIVEQCSEWLKSRYLPEEVLSKMSENQRNHYLRLFAPQVKLGELDIEDVMGSIYFFS